MVQWYFHLPVSKHFHLTFQPTNQTWAVWRIKASKKKKPKIHFPLFRTSIARKCSSNTSSFRQSFSRMNEKVVFSTFIFWQWNTQPGNVETVLVSISNRCLEVARPSTPASAACFVGRAHVFRARRVYTAGIVCVSVEAIFRAIMVLRSSQLWPTGC